MLKLYWFVTEQLVLLAVLLFENFIVLFTLYIFTFFFIELFFYLIHMFLPYIHLYIFFPSSHTRKYVRLVMQFVPVIRSYDKITNLCAAVQRIRIALVIFSFISFRPSPQCLIIASHLTIPLLLIIFCFLCDNLHICFICNFSHVIISSRLVSCQNYVFIIFRVKCL